MRLVQNFRHALWWFRESVILPSLLVVKTQPSWAVVTVVLLLNAIAMGWLAQGMSMQSAVLAKQLEIANQLQVTQGKFTTLAEQTLHVSVQLKDSQITLAEATKKIGQANAAVLGTADVAPISIVPVPAATEMAINKPVALGIVLISPNAGVEKTIYDTQQQTTAIETVKPGAVMLYYKKEAGWYQVDAPTHLGVTGWIQQDHLTEVPNVTELPR
jgi:hypothetical protein